MHIAIIGTGYVGLVTGAALAKLGHTVHCVDIDKKKVRMINSGKAPIYEKGLEPLLKKVVGKKLFATTSLEAAIAKTDACFIAVGTPQRRDGSPNLKYIHAVASQIGVVLKKLRKKYTVVVKSTVLPGTTENVGATIEKASGMKIGLGMNPEFLREGVALEDFLHPDRIVIGAREPATWRVLESIYRKVRAPVVRTDIRTAEMIKYASNAFLAAKVSMVNEVGNLCKALDIDAYEVAGAVGMDSRIGPKFLLAGAGFGGSCFPKDVQALVSQARGMGYTPTMLEAVLEVNKKQPLRMVALAKQHMTLKGKHVCVLGLAFKKGTDDIRESRAIPLVERLLREGAMVTVYDPEAMPNARRLFKRKVKYAKSARDAVLGKDVCFIATDWPEFKKRKLYPKRVLVIDGRNIARRKENYEGICW